MGSHAGVLPIGHAITAASNIASAVNLQPSGCKHVAAAQSGFAIQFWSRVLKRELWLVRDSVAREKMTAKGVENGPVWTLGELRALAGMPPDDLRSIGGCGIISALPCS
jgi:hypothetical protein